MKSNYPLSVKCFVYNENGNVRICTSRRRLWMSALGPYINGNKFFDKFVSIGGVMNGSSIHIATTNTTIDLQKQGLRQKSCMHK